MTARGWWAAAFIAALFAPVLLRLLSAERQGYSQELVTVTGLLALSLLVCTVVLPARLKSLTAAFGIEAVLGNHRVLGLSTAVMTLAHLMAVLVADPRSVALLDPLTAPPQATAGLSALVALLTLVLLTVARRRTRYESWRLGHVALSLAVVVGIGVHVVLIGHLVTDPIAAGMLAAFGAALVVVGVRRWMIQPLRGGVRFTVARVHAEAPGVSTLVLRPDRGRHSQVRFRPGQFAWLRLGRAPLAEEHPFTISSAVQDGSTLQFTIRQTGDWTTGPLRRLRAGDFIWLDGPHGALTPDGRANDGLVLIAGGVGITPMMSMIRTLARRGDDRPVHLFLLDRPGELLFRAELTLLKSQLKLEIHEFRGVRITPDLLAPELPLPFQRRRLDYFVCGPPRLVEDTVSALAGLDIPRRHIHTELFDLA